MAPPCGGGSARMYGGVAVGGKQHMHPPLIKQSNMPDGTSGRVATGTKRFASTHREKRRGGGGGSEGGRQGGERSEGREREAIPCVA